VTAVTIHQAKTQLSKLIAKAQAGEEVVIMRGKRPIARLLPIIQTQGKRLPGRLKGKIGLPNSFFFDPLPEAELRAWEGEYEGPR